MNNVYLSIGSNLGNRIINCKKSLREISRISIITSLSSLYETVPIGNSNQPRFINLAVSINTRLPPPLLLRMIKKIEANIGRFKNEKWGPRIIDIDIIFYNNICINHSSLVIPHPSAHSRRFVMEPINEIAPNLIHPVLKRDITTLLKRVKQKQFIRKVGNIY